MAEITKEELEKEYGTVWTTDELGDDFEVISFLAPYAIVRRLADNKKGSVQFIHRPRFYFDFNAN